MKLEVEFGLLHFEDRGQIQKNPLFLGGVESSGGIEMNLYTSSTLFKRAFFCSSSPWRRGAKSFGKAHLQKCREQTQEILLLSVTHHQPVSTSWHLSFIIWQTLSASSHLTTWSKPPVFSGIPVLASDWTLWIQKDSQANASQTFFFYLFFIYLW